MATELLLKAKLAMFIGVLAVLLLLALVDPAYEPMETL
jgi:hypothetical protein